MSVSDRECCIAVLMLLSILVLPGQQLLAQERLVIDGVSYRDPTQPLGATRSQGDMVASPTGSDFEVSFIRTGGNGNVAVINGQTVRAGDVIGRARVVRIEEDTVILDTGDELIELSTFRATFRSPAQ